MPVSVAINIQFFLVLITLGVIVVSLIAYFQNTRDVRTQIMKTGAAELAAFTIAEQLRLTATAESWESGTVEPGSSLFFALQATESSSVAVKSGMRMGVYGIGGEVYAQTTETLQTSASPGVASNGSRPGESISSVVTSAGRRLMDVFAEAYANGGGVVSFSTYRPAWGREDPQSAFVAPVIGTNLMVVVYSTLTPYPN